MVLGRPTATRFKWQHGGSVTYAFYITTYA